MARCKAGEWRRGATRDGSFENISMRTIAKDISNRKSKWWIKMHSRVRKWSYGDDIWIQRLKVQESTPNREMYINSTNENKTAPDLCVDLLPSIAVIDNPHR
jgi:hypothetical protein